MKLHELLGRLNNLKRMPRTGWLLCDVQLGDVEDVAQHSFEVAAITLLLLDEVGREGKKLASDRALIMAIIHDWAEAEVADFPYTALKHLGPERKREMERSALEEMLHGLPRGEDYIDIWEDYTEKRSLEAKLVHAADYLSMLLQAIKYLERGIRSKELEELWQAVNKDLKVYEKELPPVKRLIKELNARRSAIP